MRSLLQFVDSIADSPSVRLDLNDGIRWRMIEGTEFPPPPLKRAVADTLLADGGVIPASAYDFRTLILRLSLEDGSGDEVAAQLQNLHRELDRPGNIIRWREQGTTTPVFFRTFRTSPSAVARYGQPDGRRKHVTIDIPAEPFAYGLREDPISNVVLDADPAAATRPNYIDVTGVKGDVETPALIRWPHSSALQSGRVTLVATRRRGDPSAAPYLLQAEAMVQGVDTATQPSDANFSGSGNNYSRCTFATTATLATRLDFPSSSWSSPAPSSDFRGRYRAFLRYRKNTSSDDIRILLLWGLSGGIQTENDEFTTPNDTQIHMAGLGEVQFPRGNDPVVDARSGQLLSVLPPKLFVRARRASGSGSIDFDYLVLVPADDRYATVAWTETAAGPDHWWLDAYDNSAHPRNTGDNQVSTAAPPSVSGGLPLLSPNQNNRIYILKEAGSVSAATLSSVSGVYISYYPRYLHVRPASS